MTSFLGKKILEYHGIIGLIQEKSLAIISFGLSKVLLFRKHVIRIAEP